MADTADTIQRAQPAITPETEFYWSSGADGRLRVQECLSCAALIHPPRPICRDCRGERMGVRVVSGYATLIGFTVNHRFAAPGLPPPYVVAQVALEEDSRVRLTTNAVECEPDQLALGQRMEVVFQRAGAAWLPLFRPAAGDTRPAGLPADPIAPAAMREHVRPMATREKFEDKVAITGVGMSDIGRRLMVDPLSLTAGGRLADIDGLSTYPGSQLRGAAGERQVPRAGAAVVSGGGLTPSGVLLLRAHR